MRSTTLFLLGLALGAAAVFAVRAANRSPAAGASSPPGAHEGHEPEAASGSAGHAHEDPGEGTERPPENRICPVMGNPVDPDVYVDHEGRRIGFCCPGCDTQFLADPERYLRIVDEELAAREAEAPGPEPGARYACPMSCVVAEAAGPCPVCGMQMEAVSPEEAETAKARVPENEICPVTGDEVDPEVHVDHEGRRIGFCCPRCLEAFRADPERYLEKVDEELRRRGGGR